MIDEDAQKNEVSVAGKPSWIKMKSSELEKIVVELAKQGESPAQIGLILRDKYGVPKARLLGKRIKDMLKEKGIDYISEKAITEKKVQVLRELIGKNKQVHQASRSLTKKLWFLHAIEKRSK